MVVERPFISDFKSAALEGFSSYRSCAVGESTLSVVKIFFLSGIAYCK